MFLSLCLVIWSAFAPALAQGELNNAYCFLLGIVRKTCVRATAQASTDESRCVSNSTFDYCIFYPLNVTELTLILIYFCFLKLQNFTNQSVHLNIKYRKCYLSRPYSVADHKQISFV